MPPQQQKSSLMAKMGKRLTAAHEKAKTQETHYDSGGELPPGVEGIAQLVDIKFDVYKDGEKKNQYFFYAAGVVVEPATFTPAKHGSAQVKCRGKRTSIIEPMCDTPKGKGRKTFEEHLDWVYNELRKLGVDTASLEPGDLDGTLAALKAEQPYFEFRTWQGKATDEYPDPRVNHTWGGAAEYTPEEDAEGDGVVDQTEEAGPPPAAKPTPKAPAKPGTKKPAPEPEPELATDEPVDVDDLAVKADDGDEQAVLDLTKLAEDAGVTEDQIAKANNWAEVADLYKALTGGDSAEDTGPAVVEGEVYLYTKPGVHPKTKKPYKQAEVQVEASDPQARTADVFDLADHKIKHKGVSWDALVVPGNG